MFKKCFSADALFRRGHNDICRCFSIRRPTLVRLCFYKNGRQRKLITLLFEPLGGILDSLFLNIQNLHIWTDIAYILVNSVKTNREYIGRPLKVPMRLWKRYGAAAIWCSREMYITMQELWIRFTRCFVILWFHSNRVFTHMLQGDFTGRETNVPVSMSPDDYRHMHFNSIQ